MERSKYKAVRSSVHQDSWFPTYAMDNRDYLAFKSHNLAKSPWIEFEFAETIDISALEIIFSNAHTPESHYFKPGVQIRIGNTTTSMQDLGNPKEVDDTHPLLSAYRQVCINLFIFISCCLFNLFQFCTLYITGSKSRIL